jgi:hypothetical protein
MLITSEIRWIIKGKIPSRVMDWFKDFEGKPNQAPARTDHYLRLPGDGIGIKIREGLLEHKQRSEGDGERGRIREEEKWTNGHCSGVLQQWEKLSFPIDNSNAIQETLSTYQDSWIGIEKRRSLRILEMGESGKVAITSYEKVTGCACGWELTDLNIEGSTDQWWTMGFEAFGDDTKLMDTLTRVCELVLHECPFEFNTPDSQSYPEWINGISRH